MGISRTQVIVAEIIRYNDQNVLGVTALRKRQKERKEDNGQHELASFPHRKENIFVFIAY